MSCIPECDMPPLFRYNPAYSLEDLSRLKPKEHSLRGTDNVSSKELLYIDTGNFDIEWAIQEHYLKILKVAKKLGWKDKRLFDEMEDHLSGQPLVHWKETVKKPEFSGNNQKTENFKPAWDAYMRLRFKMIKMKDNMYQHLTERAFKKPKREEPNKHQDRFMTMLTGVDELPDGDVPVASEPQQKMWYFKSYEGDDRSELTSKGHDPAKMTVSEITAFMQGIYDKKVKKGQIKPYGPGERERIQEQSRRDRAHHRERSRSGSPRIPRKKRAPRHHGGRSRQPNWRKEHEDDRKPSWRRHSRRGRDFRGSNGSRHGNQGRQHGRHNHGQSGHHSRRHGDRGRDHYGRGHREDADHGRRGGRSDPPEDRGRAHFRRGHQSHHQDMVEDDGRRSRSRSRDRHSPSPSRGRSRSSSRSISRGRSRSSSRSYGRSYSRSSSEGRSPEIYHAAVSHAARRARDDSEEEPALPKNPEKVRRGKRARQKLKERKRLSKNGKPASGLADLAADSDA